MPREQINPNSAIRLLATYNDFSGGLNTETSNERLKDTEFPTFLNVDLNGRGSARRRYGRTSVLSSPPSGTVQGMFTYYREGQTNPDLVLAVGGQLYLVPASNQSTYQALSISGLTGGFQTTRPVDAAQYGTTLYIATGTKLCQYDGTSASVVTPYTPSTQEAVWIGLNGLASNPSGYLSDTTQSSGISVSGIVPQYPTGAAANKPAQFTAYVNYVSGDGIDYQWQYQGPKDTTWQAGLNYAGTAGTNKTWTFTPNEGAGSYNISVTAKDLTTNTTSTTYYLMGYTVAETLPTQPHSSTGIQTCNIIKLYWDRIVLCGDTSNPAYMYISDLQNPAYFPEDNTIDWDMGRREPITALQMFRDSLFIFTPTTIQALEGESVETYKKNLIHTEYGAVAGKSVQVVNNMILFLSYEGIMALQPNIYLTYYNIVRMDYPIRTEVLNTIDVNASSAFWDNQYWLCFPSQSIIYRYYFDYKAWVKDSSSKLNLFDQLHHGELLYNIGNNGNIYQVDRSVYNDAGEIYTMQITSKFFDFDLVFSPKKLKRVYMLAKDYEDHNVNLTITVTADAAMVLNPTAGQVSIDANGNAIWSTTTSPNFEYYAGTTLGSWVLGSSPLGYNNISIQEAYLTGGSKINRTQIQIEHAEDSKCEIFGFAFQFRQKRLA